MPTFNNLPGVQIKTNDNGLAALRVPSSKAVLIIGTAGKGPADDVFTVVDRATAALTYGLTGTLAKAMEEVAAGGCDNITLYRIGATPAVLSGVGKVVGASSSVTLSSPTASSSGVASTTTLTVTGSGDTVAGTLAIQVGSGTANTLTVPSGTSLGTLASLINANSAFITANVSASVTGLVLTISGPATASSTLVTTGTTLTKTAATVSAGATITFGQVSSDAGTRYKIWYKSGVLYVYLDGQVVYAIDAGNNVAINTTDSSVVGTVTSTNGLQIGSGSTPSLTAAVSLTAAGALTGSGTTPAPALTNVVTGLGMTARQTYIAYAKAFDILNTFPTEVIYCPNAFADQPNVAYYVASDATTAVNNPATNADALDWLKTSLDAVGNSTYQWANDTVDSNGATVTAMTANSATARLAAGFYEVNFPYLIASFCQLQESIGQSGTCIGFIGTAAPLTFKLVDLRNWVGFLPTYDVTLTSKPTAPGKGLLGIPIFAGTTAAKLNQLTIDQAQGFRTKGLFLTAEGQYDGTIQTDANGNNVDIGAYIHIVADYAALSNGYARNYASNLAGYTAGYYSTLDPKVNLTFKNVLATQLWKPSEGQCDALTQIGINVLRFVGTGSQPVLLHGVTQATPSSDYTSLLRQNIKGAAIKTIRQVAKQFIGFGNLDGLQQQSLITALTKNFTILQQKGYLNNFNFAVTTSASDLRIGHGSISVTFHPADELVQLTAVVGFVPAN